jgi:DtxR family Mn-dependent transcriptional regulator
MNYSISEENYIKAIYHLIAQGQTASTTAIAEHLQTKASSVTDMLQKLADKDLVNYIKYRGVQLTASGQREALKTVRKHRLWEVFLVEKLGFGWDEVHEVAEQLEHIQSAKLVERLAIFLDSPQFDPHGDPIPDANGRLPKNDEKPLSLCQSGEAVVLKRVSDGNPDFLQYLERQSLILGERMVIKEKFSFDNSLEIERMDQSRITLSETVANHLFVSLI